MARQPLTLDSIPDLTWDTAAQKAKVLAPLAERANCTTEQIDEAARQLQVSRATVYRLLARYKQDLQATSLLPEMPGRKQGSKELSPVQERIIQEALRGYFLSPQRPSVAALYRSVALDCFGAGVAKPAYKTIRARVKAVNPRELVRARQGARIAAQKFNSVLGKAHADHPLELVQIDHTLVDIIVVDERERKPIGRPWLTLAIDIATRTVPGFYLSLHAPSSLSVAMVLNHAVLAKEQYLAAFGVNVLWPVQGLPQTLHMDNAKEFYARALVRGCQQHGIEVVHRPPLQPHYGGHIERLIGTMMGEVHLLPGATFRSVSDRGDYDSDQKSAMTIQELETWLAWQIPGVYHTRKHTSLGCSPLEAWNEGLRNMPAPPRVPADPLRFYLDFLPLAMRTIGRDGIRLFNVLYWNGALEAKVSADGTKHVIKYDPRDMSRIYLAEPQGTYLEVPYRDLAHPRASLRELQEGAKLLRQPGVSTVDEDQLFRVVQEQRALVQLAKSKTQKARRKGQERSADHRVGTPVPAPSPVSSAGMEDLLEPFPFEIWK